MKGRLKALRKELGLTQSEFGKKIGMSDTAISHMEAGRTAINDQNVNLVCLTFGVSGQWLRLGEGDMFSLEDNDPLINEVVRLMEKMSPEERQVVLNYVRWYASQQQTLMGKESPPEKSGGESGVSSSFPLEPRRPDEDFSSGFEESRTAG